MSTVRHAYHYAERLGLAVVPIPSGLKGPREAGWNKPENTVRTGQQARDTFGRQALNMGVLHSASDTGTLDIDHQEWAGMALAAIGYDLAALQAWPVRIKGKNGEKPFFRLGGRVFDRHSISWPHPTKKQLDKDGNETSKPVQVTLFELRAGAVQDVLPPSIHPDTGKAYEWAGTPPRERGDIPMISDELCDLWENWEDFAAKMQAACPWQVAPVAAYKPCGSSSPKGERPGDHFRASVHVTVVLLRNGYVQKGARFLPPGASSTVAGVRILRGEDGIDRAFSDHGSCPLNNDHAHDSFSALAILEHGGNFRAAARAAALELGLTDTADHPESSTEQVQQRWLDAQPELIHKGCEVLDQAQGHPRQKSSLFDLWAMLTELACTNVWERGGKFYINLGGLNNLKAQGITGRPADISTRIHYLAGLGFHRGVTKKDPTDQFSQLLIEIPADPLTLPFMSLTRQDAESLNVSVPTLNQRTVQPKKVQRKFITTKERSTYGSYELALCFAAARQTVAWLLACPGATISELAAMRKKHPEVIRRHVRSLVQAGLAKREKRSITLTGSWAEFRAALRLERESSDTFRRRIVTALKRTIHFCRASIYLKPALPPSQVKRRQHMMKIATTRLSRLEAGEPVYQVMGLAA